MHSGELETLFQIFNGTETRGRLSSVTSTWEPRSRAWGGFVPNFLTLRNYGAGEATQGTREIELQTGSGVEARDGIEAVGGPEVGTRWRVVSVDRANPMRDTLRVKPFSGSFTQ